MDYLVAVICIVALILIISHFLKKNTNDLCDVYQTQNQEDDSCKKEHVQKVALPIKQYKHVYLKYQVTVDSLSDSNVVIDLPTILLNIPEDLKKKILKKDEVTSNDVMDVYFELKNRLQHIKLPDVSDSNLSINSCAQQDPDRGFIAVHSNIRGTSDESVLIILKFTTSDLFN